MTRFRQGLLATVAAATLATATWAQERDLRAAPATPPTSPVTSVMYTKLAEYLPEESQGHLKLAMIGMEVVSYREMQSALKSQLADVGNVLPAFFPSDLPSTAMTLNLALLGSDPFAMSAAMTEYAVTCGDCQTEFGNFGIVYTGSVSSDPYVILTRKPVKNLADLKGLRLRTPPGPYARWLEAAGAIPVDVTPPEVFESLSQGVIDGTLASVLDLQVYNLTEVVKSVTDMPLGLYYTTATTAMSSATWAQLSEDDRRAYMRANARAAGDMIKAWGYDMPAGSVEKAKAAGVEFVEPSEDLVAFTEKTRAHERETAAETTTATYSVTDAQAKIDRFTSLVDKWTAISKEVNGDPAAMAARLQSEIWDKIDYAKYGL